MERNKDAVIWGVPVGYLIGESRDCMVGFLFFVSFVLIECWEALLGDGTGPLAGVVIPRGFSLSSIVAGCYAAECKDILRDYR